MHECQGWWTWVRIFHVRWGCGRTFILSPSCYSFFHTTLPVVTLSECSSYPPTHILIFKVHKRIFGWSLPWWHEEITHFLPHGYTSHFSSFPFSCYLLFIFLIFLESIPSIVSFVACVLTIPIWHSTLLFTFSAGLEICHYAGCNSSHQNLPRWSARFACFHFVSCQIVPEI